MSPCAGRYGPVGFPALCVDRFAHTRESLARVRRPHSSSIMVNTGLMRAVFAICGCRHRARNRSLVPAAGVWCFVVALAVVSVPAPFTPAAGQTSDRVEFVTPKMRDVTPPGIIPWPQGQGPLVREETRPNAGARAGEPQTPRWHRFYLVQTTDAATFDADGMIIRVSGVTSPEVADTCALADGASWPCGRSARHASRMFVRGRAVECYFPFVDSLQEITAPCRVGGADLGLWLVTRGWARTSDLATDAYREAEGQARCSGSGLWRAVPPGADCGSSVAER